MKGIHFHMHKPTLAESPNRMDIACFVGFVDCREGAPRDDIDEWLYRQGWRHSKDGYQAQYHRDSTDDLMDVPLPIESWLHFDQLFAWNERDYGNGRQGAGYLAAAVRSFFAQGGRKCYVVRAGSPPAAESSYAQREALLDRLVPGFALVDRSIAVDDRETWNGVGHLLGLPEVAMLCLPDLPDLLRREQTDPAVEAPPVSRSAERFIECSEPAAMTPPDSLLEGVPAPGCDAAGYLKWAEVIQWVARFIARQRRDVQLVASIPLPSAEIDDPFRFLLDQGGLAETLDNGGIASAFVQLSYPWLQTPGSKMLPQQIEPAEGALAGMLASNALARGAFRSVTGLRQTDISAVHPRLSREAMHGFYATAEVQPSSRAPLIERVSLFGDSIGGVVLLSDVTTSKTPPFRPASVNRIVALVVRATRQLGEEFVLENNGEALWSEITQRLNSLFVTLFNLGALRGKEPDDAFLVRCDRSTMSQQDLDSGRVIALIHFEPAATIESIDIVLNLQQLGQLSLQSIGIEQLAS